MIGAWNREEHLITSRWRGNGRSHLAPLLMASLILALPASCRSGKTAEPSASASAADHLDVGCMLDQVQRPAEPFHYSYEYADASRKLDEEADVTPQSIDIDISDESGTHRYHGVRADEQSWSNAMLDLSSLSFTGMMGRMAGYDGTSVVRARGAEQMNGYSVTRYEIDSGGANPADRDTFITLFGAGSFDKGTVWMGSDGCAVKILLDEGLSQPNGPVEKRHFEINRLKPASTAPRKEGIS